MDYKARAYDPLLMRFIQPDTIIPNPADPQHFDHYAYVGNRPIVFADPSGHRACEHSSEKGRCLEGKGGLIHDLEGSYRIRIKGAWDEGELRYLRDSLSKTASWAGGVETLNQIFREGIGGGGSVGDRLVIHNRAGTGRPAECGIGTACWIAGRDAIMLGDDVFTATYQRTTIAGGLWGSQLEGIKLGLAIQKTMVHEIGHVLISGSPEAVDYYAQSVTDLHASNPGYPLEENLASSIAVFVVDSSAGLEDQNNYAGHVLDWLGY